MPAGDTVAMRITCAAVPGIALPPPRFAWGVLSG
jgi:hypothetical protein